MKTIRRLILGELMYAIVFVTVGFLSLFFFFDFVDQLQSIGRPTSPGYQLPQALTYVTLLIPSHLYELLPITVLIGCIFVMARFAQSSEFTILRTSGLGPWRALRTLLTAGLVAVVLTFAVGDYLAPWADRNAQLLKAQFDGSLTVGQTGAWLKEKQPTGQFAVNVNAMGGDGRMLGLRIFEFDRQGKLAAVTRAESATIGHADEWILQGVERTSLAVDAPNGVQVARTRMPAYTWPTEISAEMVSTAVLKPERMSTIDLFQYVQHLNANGQTAQRYEIEFWKKVFYPLSCLVMVVLALPFAYLHFRSEGISGYVFGGVMAGISFFFLNNVSGYIGELQHWQPWLTAALPGMIYSVLSLAAFGWLVLNASLHGFTFESPTSLQAPPLTDTSTQRGIVFFGHGSRDPLWHKPIEAVAVRAKAIDARVHVACAYLELTQPDLPDCVAAMAADGVRHITIVPLFLGVGRHAREDLPGIVTTLVSQHADVEFKLQAAIGEDPRLVDLIARIALGTD